MTGRHGGRSRSATPSVSLPAVVGRLRADRGPLALVLVVVVLATTVASAVPRLMERTADAAVRYSVATAGVDAELTALRPIQESPWEERTLRVDIAAGLAGLADQVRADMGDALADILAEPVTTVATSSLAPATPSGPVLHSLRMYHLGADAAHVEWLSGGPAPATLTGDQALAWDEEHAPWPVAAALSVDVAADLGLAVGDHLALQNENKSVAVDLVVSGVFRAIDPAEPVWSHATEVLSPRTVGSTLTQRTRVGVLLSDDELPIAIRAMPAGSTAATITFQPVAAAVRSDAVTEIVAEIAGLKAEALDSQAGGFYAEANQVDTDLDALLRTAAERTRAGAAQAWVLLAGVLAALGLTLLLAARLLLHRRADVLLTYRARGATALGLAVELGAESVLLAAVGTALGVWLAAALVPGTPPWPWLLPPAIVAAAAPPVLAVWHVVRRTRGGRRAANRHDRRVLERDRLAARALAEAAVLLAAVGAVAALRTRRVGPEGPDPLIALAPTLVAVAAGILLLHVLPVALHWSLRRARRSRRLVTLLSVARAHTTGTAVLPFVTIAMAAALAGLSATVAATVVEGQEQASWTVTGAEALVQHDPDAALLAVAADLSARPDVTAVPGTEAQAQAFGRWGDTLVTVVALPAREYAALLAQAPLPSAPGIATLADAAAAESSGADPVPVLVSEGIDAGQAAMSLLWDGVSVDVRSVGTAPAIFGEDVVVVDTGSFERSTGVAPAPDRLWVVGAGAERAVASTPALAGSDVQLRSAWLSANRADPLALAVLRLARAACLLLVALGALAVVLAAAATARERATTLAKVSTLGVDRRGARLVTAGELLPAVVIAALGGLGCAVVLSVVVVVPLGLRLVTMQQTTPRTVLPVLAGGPVVVAVVTVAVLVGLESIARRRQRLGTVLRMGGR